MVPGSMFASGTHREPDVVSREQGFRCQYVKRMLSEIFHIGSSGSASRFGTNDHRVEGIVDAWRLGGEAVPIESQFEID